VAIRRDWTEALKVVRKRRRMPGASDRRLIRERSGLTQNEVARVLGVSRPSVARYEGGQREPPRLTAERYLTLLDALIVELMYSGITIKFTRSRSQRSMSSKDRPR
jgi:transcriptional regulator with XRE-family HTH domain